MKRPSVFSGRRENVEIKMTPMIDVVFLLLVFFVWTASFQVVENILPGRLSEVTGSEPTPVDQVPPPEEDFDHVVIRIRWVVGAPKWQVNDAEMPTLVALRERLSAISSIKSDAPVILHPDAEVPLGHVIDAFDSARVAGFEQVQFAATPSI